MQRSKLRIRWVSRQHSALNASKTRPNTRMRFPPPLTDDPRWRVWEVTAQPVVVNVSLGEPGARWSTARQCEPAFPRSLIQTRAGPRPRPERVETHQDASVPLTIPRSSPSVRRSTTPCSPEYYSAPLKGSALSLRFGIILTPDVARFAAPPRRILI